MMYDEIDELQDLMSEPPGGHNFGSRAADMHPDDIESGRVLRRRPSLQTAALPYLERTGYGVVHPGMGGTKGNPGGRAVHPDEYVDPDVLRQMAEDTFGFTRDDVESVYSVKRIRPDQRQLRDRIDARLLAFRRSGANMYRLAEVMGMAQRTMNRALDRAEAAEVGTRGDQ